MQLSPTIPESPARLRELLLTIFDGRPFLRFAGVNTDSASLEIIWQDEARGDGYRNTCVPLKRDQLGQAQRLVEHLLSQISLGLPPSEAAAEELFAMTAGHGDRLGDAP